MIYCILGTLNQSALLFKSDHWLVSFAAVFRDVTQRPLPFGEALHDIPQDGCEVDYHLASAMDSHSRTKGTCIVFVAF